MFCFPANRLAQMAALSLLTGFAATSSAAQTNRCQGEISFRLWSENREAAYEFGETVQIATGKEGHLYIMAQAAGINAYQAIATIGYPDEFGFKAGLKQVLPHVRMEAQNAEDRGNGRIRFVASQPGRTWLGYQIEDVVPPGRIDRVPQGCRKGQVAIEVLGAGPSTTSPKPTLSSDQAARELVGVLYVGLLRRSSGRQADESLVVEVLQHHRTGVQRVAEILMESTEFRDEALARTRQRFPQFSGARLREALLVDIYRTLYGRTEPPRTQLYANLEDLELCLSGSRFVETCGRLGRELVNSPLFDQKHRDLLTAVETAPLAEGEKTQPNQP